MDRTGVLLLGFGGPDSLDAVGPFMCNLMGREPSDELVERVCRRYLTIGGASPLTGIAESMAAGLASRLADTGHDVPVRIGMRYWEPFIEDAIAGLVAEGCKRVITVSLSPFESKVTSGAYREEVERVAEIHGGLTVVEAPLLSTLPEYVEFYAGSTAVGINDIEPNNGAIVLFTAHSLPESDVAEDDSYVRGLERVANAVALKLGMEEGAMAHGEAVLPGITAFGSSKAPRAWFLVYQSQGERPGAWLGPELSTAIAAAQESDVSAVVVSPIGFMTDHMETLYDLDVIAAEQAMDADLGWQRARVPNDDAALLDGLARVVTELL